MKKIISFLIVLPLCIILSSCFSIDGIRSDIVKEEESDKIHDITNDIHDALVLNPSKENFKNLFCQNVQETESFSEIVDSIFLFIDEEKEALGDTVITEYAPLSGLNSGVNYDGLKKTNWYMKATQYRYKNVVEGDDVALWYEVHYSYTFYYQAVDIDDPSDVGLHYLTIKLLNTTKQITIGTNEFTEA